MAHKCKCVKCNIEFDRDKIPAVQISARRYGHASCYPEIKEILPIEVKLEDDPDYQAIIKYCEEIFGDKLNYAMTKKYIKKFVNENKYSLSGILKSLVYFYGIKKNPIDKANGSIGIVPFIYQDSYNYYYALFMAQQNTQKSKFIYNEKTRTIKQPKSKGLFKRFFKIEVDEDEEQ